MHLWHLLDAGYMCCYFLACLSIPLLLWGIQNVLLLCFAHPFIPAVFFLFDQLYKLKNKQQVFMWARSRSRWLLLPSRGTRLFVCSLPIRPYAVATIDVQSIPFNVWQRIMKKIDLISVYCYVVWGTERKKQKVTEVKQVEREEDMPSSGQTVLTRRTIALNICSNTVQ